MIRGSSGSLPNITHPRPQRTYRWFQWEEWGLEGWGYLVRKQALSYKGLMEISEGNKLGGEEKNTEGLLIIRKGFLG